eukprot:1089053-Rhodomonas_salina.1
MLLPGVRWKQHAAPTSRYPSSLPTCYAMSGTDIVHGTISYARAMQCPVLTQRGVYRDVPK